MTRGTTAVYITVLVGMFLAQAPIWAGIKTGTTRDLIYLIELSVIIIAGLAVYGTPGRTLHHYPSAALIRRGAPRWWKGLAASVVLVSSAVIGFEGLQRPILERRGSKSLVHTPEHIDWAIDVWMGSSYACRRPGAGLEPHRNVPGTAGPNTGVATAAHEEPGTQGLASGRMMRYIRI